MIKGARLHNRISRCSVIVCVRGKSLKLTLLIFCLGFFSGGANSSVLSSKVIVQSGDLSLTPYTSVLYGAPSDLTISDVLVVKKQGGFTPLDSNGFNKGITDKIAWLSFTLGGKALIDDSLDLYLLIGNSSLSQIDIFIDGKPYGEYPTLGQKYEFPQRAIDQPEFIVPIRLKTSERVEFMVKVQTSTSLNVPLKIFTERAFLNSQLKQQFVLGAYYGLIIIMCAFYFLVYGNTQEKVYLYFSASLASLVAVELQIDGYLFQYLYPSYPEVSFKVFSSLAAAVYVFAFAFAREFLSTGAVDPFIDRLFKILTIAGVLLAVSAFVLPEIAVFIYGVPFCLIGGSVCLLAGVNNIAKGYRSGYFYLAAIGAVTIGSAIYIAMFVGLLPSNWFSQHVLKITTTIEVLLLSFALTDRIRAIRKEKDAMKDSMVKTLKEQNRSKDEFLAIVSHELRTPMNGVQGALDLVKHQPLSTEVRDYIEMASISSDNMVTLINDILDFTELQNHEAKIKSSIFPFKNDVSKLFDRYKKSNRNENITYHLTISENLETYYKGDSQKIFKVIKHLLNNAVKFTERGSIQLTLGLKSCLDGTAAIQIIVKDSGCGIAEEKQSTIFDAFQQEDVSLSRSEGGVGLGLSITQRLLESLGGNLKFSSEKGVGSEFSVEFNLANVALDEVPKDRTGIQSTESATPELYVLVVEDNIVNQKVLVGILKKLGHKTCIANNGQEGVDRVSIEAVDLVLMDCQMPVMDGLQATREIRKVKGFENLPIIAITANAMSEDEALCLDAGMNDFMAKPVNRGGIKRIVDKWSWAKRQDELSVQTEK